jgi:hypothetical protein
MDINEINVELCESFQRYVNECCEFASDGKIDGFGAGCCKCRGGCRCCVVIYLFIYFLINACNLKVMAKFTELNDRNQTLHRAPAGLCPSPDHTLWGLKTKISPCSKSTMRLLFQVPCLHRGRHAGLPPFPSIFSYLSAFISSAVYLLQAFIAPHLRHSLPILLLLCQPPCCPSSPLSSALPTPIATATPPCNFRNHHQNHRFFHRIRIRRTLLCCSGNFQNVTRRFRRVSS